MKIPTSSGSRWLLIAGARLMPAMAFGQFIYRVSGTTPTSGAFGAWWPVVAV